MTALYNLEGGIAYFQNTVDGNQQPALSAKTLESIDPARAETWAVIPAGKSDDIDQAVNAAQTAFNGQWKQLPALQRAALLRNLAALIGKYKNELASIESRDNGRVINETLNGDLPAVEQMFYYWAGAADKLHGETVDISPSSFNFVRHEPIGVVGIIIPWNAPLALFAAKVGAALAAGNTVVVKPAEQASCSVLAVAQLFKQAGFPDGVVNVVAGLGTEAGDAIASHPGIGKITFTGSTPTAQAITRSSAQAIKPLSFELGGKSANIIFDDADLDAAALGASTMSVFTGGAGQVCVAGSRILIQDTIFDEMIQRITKIASRIKLGNPLDSGTQMGPICFDKQFEKVKSYIELGKKEGGEVVFGGNSGASIFDKTSAWSEGFFVEPTLFSGVNNAMRICQEEIFGPVACVIPFSSEEEALAIANDSPFGLACGLWTNNLKRTHRFIANVHAGAVWVNSYRKIHWAVPFGGVKDSGYGRDSGLESLRGYMQTKGVWIDLG